MGSNKCPVLHWRVKFTTLNCCRREREEPKDLWVAKYHFPTSKTVHFPKLTCKELYSGVINSPKTSNPPVLEAPLSVILSVEDFSQYPKASSNPPYPPSVIPPDTFISPRASRIRTRHVFRWSQLSLDYSVP